MKKIFKIAWPYVVSLIATVAILSTLRILYILFTLSMYDLTSIFDHFLSIIKEADKYIAPTFYLVSFSTITCTPFLVFTFKWLKKHEYQTLTFYSLAGSTCFAILWLIISSFVSLFLPERLNYYYNSLYGSDFSRFFGRNLFIVPFAYFIGSIYSAMIWIFTVKSHIDKESYKSTSRLISIFWFIPFIAIAFASLNNEFCLIAVKDKGKIKKQEEYCLSKNTDTQIYIPVAPRCFDGYYRHTLQCRATKR